MGNQKGFYQIILLHRDILSQTVNCFEPKNEIQKCRFCSYAENTVLKKANKKPSEIKIRRALKLMNFLLILKSYVQNLAH